MIIGRFSVRPMKSDLVREEKKGVITGLPYARDHPSLHCECIKIKDHMHLAR